MTSEGIPYIVYGVYIFMVHASIGQWPVLVIQYYHPWGDPSHCLYSCGGVYLCGEITRLVPSQMNSLLQVYNYLTPDPKLETTHISKKRYFCVRFYGILSLFICFTDVSSGCIKLSFL
ncbi:hypothetical protein BDB01DRAFT_834515 [Pilobolus umbonatus]|nr:hypothetical protein BDB01DRAFT_834515 [Pilobolus umbonatus]